MLPPADLREGWYWVQAGSHSEMVRIYRYDGRWAVYREHAQRCALSDLLHIWTALEPVAPPSWERGE